MDLTRGGSLLTLVRAAGVVQRGALRSERQEEVGRARTCRPISTLDSEGESRKGTWDWSRVLSLFLLCPLGMYVYGGGGGCIIHIRNMLAFLNCDGKEAPGMGPAGDAAEKGTTGSFRAWEGQEGGILSASKRHLFFASRGKRETPWGWGKMPVHRELRKGDSQTQLSRVFIFCSLH